MNTKFFTGLALAAALLLGSPAFAFERGGGGGRGGGGHAVAAVHGGGGSHFAAVSRGGGHTAFVSRGGTHAFRSASFASSRSSGRRNSVAFGGGSYNSRAYGNGGNSNYTYAFHSRSGWNHNREYAWRGHHYRWFNNGWFIVDPYPYDLGYSYYGYGPDYTGYGPGYDNGGDVSVEVQQELAREGYYNGPIDGIVGPGTRSAIASYQRDNGLHVTGAINAHLLDSMGLD